MSALKKITNELNNRRNNDSKFIPELWQGLRNPGDSVQVRFLEQGTEMEDNIVWMHEYKVGKAFKYTPCLDSDSDGSPCAGCDKQIKRTAKGAINVIWRDRPQVKRDEDNRAMKTNSGQFQIDGYKDEVVVWVQGVETWTELSNKDTRYKGLSSRDFVVTKKSKGFTIDPSTNEDGDVVAVALTKADKELLKGKFDLKDTYLKKLSNEDLSRLLSGQEPIEEHMDAIREAGSPWEGRSRANRFLDNDQ